MRNGVLDLGPEEVVKVIFKQEILASLNYTRARACVCMYNVASRMHLEVSLMYGKV